MEIARKVDSKQGEIVVALAGNPNSGKTSIFNEITGARQHVGNWPGVTVEKKEGFLTYQGSEIRVVDLPGTYSLGAYSEDEVVARDYILFGNPDVVINTVDASNLERNLYLTTQLLEMGASIVLALNMYDEAKKNRVEIDVDKLSKILGVPIVPTVATKGEGIKKLIAEAIETSKKGKRKPLKIDYGKEIEEEIKKIQSLIETDSILKEKFQPRWLAVKLLEEDEQILREVEKLVHNENLLNQVQNSLKHIEEIFGEEAETVIADRRYGYISGLVREAVKKHPTFEERISVSDKIDRIVTNRYLGLPIFFLAMWMVFKFTFVLGDPMIGWIESLFEYLAGLTGRWLMAAGVSELAISLVTDGIIGGVGSVLVFIPNIFLLFFAISVLEDSGYMARAAYVMDRIMQAFGLPGKAFIPLLIGFGCNVPGVMATRTLENKNDRMISVLINPLMSCGARLPVYVLFASAFFPANEGTVIFSLYILGMVLAVIMAKVFKKFLFKGQSAPLVMELPPYRIPTLKGIFIHMWERGSAFIKKAGTIIFGVVVIVWALSNLPVGVEYASQQSIIGRIGSFLAPIFRPVGFGTWEAAASLMFGLLAKEVIVGTLGVLYGVGEEGLTAVLGSQWTALSAYSFMVMTLIYIPCVAVIGAIKRETNSWKWTFFAVGYSLVLGWIMSFIVYQGGRLLGL